MFEWTGSRGLPPGWASRGRFEVPEAVTKDYSEGVETGPQVSTLNGVPLARDYVPRHPARQGNGPGVGGWPFESACSLGITEQADSYKHPTFCLLRMSAAHLDPVFTVGRSSRSSREGLNNPILGGTRSVAVRRSGYEGLSSDEVLAGARINGPNRQEVASMCPAPALARPMGAWAPRYPVA